MLHRRSWCRTVVDEDGLSPVSLHWVRYRPARTFEWTRPASIPVPGMHDSTPGHSGGSDPPLQGSSDLDMYFTLVAKVFQLLQRNENHRPT